MNRPQRDLGIKNILKKISKGMPLIIVGIALFVFACKSDLEQVSVFATEIDLPEQSAKMLTVEYTDTAKLQMRFKAPLLNHYTNTEDPYYEFPEGIEVFFYDENEQLKSTIIANYTKFYEKEELWEARDSVVARNVQTGEKLETEQLFMDQVKKLVYSNVYTKITNENGVHYGEKGFEATQDLSSYRLIGGSGTVVAKDEE